MSDRRYSNDRRLKKKHRRRRQRGKASKQSHTVIEIAGAELRVVMLVGSDADDQVSVMTRRWRVEASTLNSETGLRELTAALIELVEKHDLQATNLQFVLGGEFCVTKAVRGTSEEVRNELQQIEQRSRLYLMLGPGEKVTVSKSQAIDARHEYAVVAVCNKQTLDTIHEAATLAGMQIDSIEPALVATSRAIGRLEGVPDEPCLLIHLDEMAVELGICHGGSLLLDYRPGGRTDARELVELVCTHLNRLQRHVGRQLRTPPPQLKRIYLCGEQAAVERAYPIFSSCEQFEVEIIDPTKIKATWKFAESVSNSEAVPALGALLNTYLPKGERHVPNFMEQLLASTREPFQPIFIRCAIPLVAVLLVALTIFAFNVTDGNALHKLQQQLDSLATVQVRDRELHLKRGAAESKLRELTALSDGLHALPVGEIVDCIGHCMPSDVWLNTMEIDSMQTVRLIGASYLEAGVFDFVNWLDQAPGFEDVALRSTRPSQSAAGPTIDFNVELNLDDWDGQIEEVARNE